MSDKKRSKNFILGSPMKQHWLRLFYVFTTENVFFSRKIILLLQLSGMKNIKKHILTSVWSAQHTNAGPNIQQLSDKLQFNFIRHSCKKCVSIKINPTKAVFYKFSDKAGLCHMQNLQCICLICHESKFVSNKWHSPSDKHVQDFYKYVSNLNFCTGRLILLTPSLNKQTKYSLCQSTFIFYSTITFSKKYCSVRAKLL